jgi:hypothetical protein
MKSITAIILFVASLAFAQGSKMELDKRTGRTMGVRYDPLGGRIYSTSVQVKNDVKSVYKKLLDCKSLCGMLQAKEISCSAALGKVGAAGKMEVMGDKGTMITSYLDPNKEIRFAWEPDNGSYLCQIRFILEPAGTGTKISFTDRFTESSPMSKEDLSKYGGDVLGILNRLAEACGGWSD